MRTMDWESIPEPILVRILGLVSVSDIGRAALTCSRWNEISSDNSLWRGQLCRRYRLKQSRNLRIRPSELSSSWREEFRRLSSLTPSVCSQKLDNHKDEVLHVSFSNSGSNFVTCSKDATVIIWRMDKYYTAELEHQEDMRWYDWKYTWTSRYNSTDTLLLVAGVITDVNGEIAIFKRSCPENQSSPSYSVLCRVYNNPYDVMGDWAAECHFFSGRLLDDGHIWPSATLYMCALNPDQPGDSAAPALTQNMVLRLQDGNPTNYLRCLHVVNKKLVPDNANRGARSPRAGSLEEEDVDVSCKQVLELNDICLIFLTNTESIAPHQLGFCLVKPEDLSHVPRIRTPDRTLDMQGHIVGISLSPDSRYLFVNVRRWPSNATLNLVHSPAIACEIEMRVVDLETLHLKDTVYTGHKGFTDSMNAFYIYVDVSRDLVASGSEDKKGRVWDRYYGCTVAELEHDECVNSVAFSPTNQQVIVSVSDDHKVKVWKSLALMKSATEPTLTKL